MGIKLNYMNTESTLAIAEQKYPYIKWSKQDVSRLKVLSTNFLSLKEMAKTMGRTPMSISSALDRYGLRVRTHIKHSREKTTRPCVTVLRQQKVKSSKSHLESFPTQIDFQSLQNWLNLKNIKVTKTQYRLPDQQQQPLYYFKGRLMPAYGVVVEANRLRLSLGLPIFHVLEITEF